MTVKIKITPPHPSWLNNASLIELSCSILAEDVILALFPLLPLPVVGPLAVTAEFGELLPPLLPFVALTVPAKFNELKK